MELHQYLRRIVLNAAGIRQQRLVSAPLYLRNTSHSCK